MQTRSAIAAKSTNRISLIFLVALILLGCANTNDQYNDQACAVSDSLVRRNGTPGVQFINACKSCVAVAFEYRNQEKESKWTACYVPAESQVIYWEAEEYWLIARKPCEIAKKHGLGGISTAILENNVHTGRCDTRDSIANETIKPLTQSA